MNRLETTLISYEAARHELVERIRLRDHALLAYLAAVGTIIGIALSPIEYRMFLHAIPYVALGCSILVSQHNSVIGALIQFIYSNIKPSLCATSTYSPLFVCSKTFEKHSHKSNVHRSLGHAVIIGLPCLYSIIFLFTSFCDLFWWFSVGFSVAAVIIIYYSHKKRMEIYDGARPYWDGKENFFPNNDDKPLL